MKQRILAFLISYIFLFPPVYANVIFENPLAELDDVTGYLSDSFVSVQLGDTFSLQTTSTINSVEWWGGFAEDFPLYPDDFTISIFELDGGIPKKTPLFLHNVGQVDVENSRFLERGGGIPEYRYFSPIAAITLDPGDYFLSIVNYIDYPYWYWHTSSASGTAWSRDSRSEEWISIPTKLAFTLSGTAIPEPGVIALFCTGLIVLLLRRRKHSSKTVNNESFA